MQIHQLSATELAAAVRDGQLRPTEVLEHTLRRAEELGPVVGAFSALTPEHAQRQALVAEELIDATPFDDLLPPLLGVPCPIKDMAAVEGLPFEGGSLALRGLRALHTDGIATLLAHAGSLMIGKTATPEFGLSCYTEPEGLPPARTPWDLTRGAGGSSGGPMQRTPVGARGSPCRGSRFASAPDRERDGGWGPPSRPDPTGRRARALRPEWIYLTNLIIENESAVLSRHSS